MRASNLTHRALHTSAGVWNTADQPPATPTPSEAETSPSAAAKRIKIYTKTGDKGTSSLFTGERRPKDDEVFEALGATDELTSALGLAKEYGKQGDLELIERLEKIQCCIQDIGSNVATPRTSANEARLNRTEFDPQGELIAEMEGWIDEMDGRLPPLRNFIIPSGGLPSTSLHVARSICRRAERRVVPLVQQQMADASVGRYLNRLSDFLFTTARYSAMKMGEIETIYRRPRGKKNTEIDE
ncbi:Adenosylcobalamin biosynthesis, ATP:cob(I)alamin adenosyltransferase-like protein [Dimargaris cristalligena]|uniref:Corrinoid adenosyltransferase MMAB n=1 Tax=Dimargaris cristalligena TaxID=215637 RepID=A0A4Q0A2U1_9FUNG|nr:Adenosylcobalamin biosynthesis, ATP:cob(I)alamin adenosyltransferase-like protein [Dimargaris cristalligena]|eukprot:RKP39851.1 Adenosylcobalamin biosynthesis, ATP:cob(I)alamin adenosyltransferase-like protein [Dimargaris cristalligena]